MKPTRRDREDFEFLLSSAREGRRQGLDHFLHLDQPLGIWNYIRIANEIADRLESGRLLDWGCGLGQMTYLLRRRGFVVTAFDIGATVAALPDLPLTRNLQIVRGTHPTSLPFEPDAFDVVLSCGVLEHVDEYSGCQGNERRSLEEIHRVLAPGGAFAIYQLPQRYTWQEAITRTLKVGYSHPRRFTEDEIRTILAEHGFRVDRLRRFNMLPKNLTGLPSPVRGFYSRFATAILALDRQVSSLPAVKHLAGVLELLARKVA